MLWVDNYVTSYKELHLYIQGEDFNLQVYSTKEPLTENLEMTSFNLDKCLKKIREKENIPDDEELIIAKYDLYDNSHTTNQIRYKVYNRKGIELSLEVCEGIKVPVDYPFKQMLTIEGEEQISIDFEFAAEIYNKYGINIYDSTDPFFNDVCFSFKNENGTEMVLDTRREIFYRNFTFCESHCEFIGLDFETSIAKCNCEIQTTFTKTLKEWEDIQQNTTPFKPAEVTQHLLYRCFKLFFKFI